MSSLRTLSLLAPLALGISGPAFALTAPSTAPSFGPSSVLEDSAFRSDLSLDDAKALAKRENKALLLAWYHAEDSRSLGYSARVWDGELFQGWATDKVIALRYDAAKRSAVGLRMNVRYYPTVLLLSPVDGTELDRLEGPVDEQPLILALESLMLGRIGTPKLPEGDRAEDPMAWLAWGNYCMSQQKFNDAVEAYMWCFDNGEAKLPGFSDRYLEFILQKTRGMNLQTRAAKAALEQRRAILADKVRGARASDLEAHMVTRLDYWLNQLELSIQLYDELASGGERSQELRMVLFGSLLERLVGERRYEDVARSLGDPKGKLLARLDEYEKGVAKMLESPDAGDALMRSDARENRSDIQADGALYYEVLLAVGKGKDAEEVAVRLLALKPNVRTYVQLIEAAHRVELAPVAENLAAKGMEEHLGDAKASRQIQRAVSQQRRMGVKRLTPTEIEKRKQERLRKAEEAKKQREQGGDGGQ